MKIFSSSFTLATIIFWIFNSSAEDNRQRMQYQELIPSTATGDSHLAPLRLPAQNNLNQNWLLL